MPYTPLTLRLAARALERLGSEALDDARLDDAIRRARADGYLQARILDSLSTPRLSNVAEIAFMLRSITPGRLLEIVGPFVAPPITDIAEAEVLFDELAKASDLVTVAVAGERRLILREEVGDEITALAHDDKPDLVRRVHQRAIDVFTGSDDEDDLDDLDYHSSELRRFDRLGAQSGSTDSASRTSIRELRIVVPELVDSGRFADALAIVEASSEALADPPMLLQGAKAAKALSEHRRCQRLSEQAIRLAQEPLDRARGHLLCAWAEPDNEIAHQHRLCARAELPAIPPRTKLTDRAEIVLGVAQDDRAWAVAKLREMFQTPRDWAELRGAELDVIRGVCALVQTRDSVRWAHQLAAFHGNAHVDYDLLAQTIHDFLQILDVPSVGRGATAADIASRLEQLQRSGELGRTMTALARVPAEPILAGISDVLEQMRRPSGAVTIDVGARAEHLALLANAITVDVRVDDLQTLVYKLGARQVIDRLKGSDFGLMARAVVNEIDRRGLGASLVDALKHMGLEHTVEVARSLWPSDDEGET